jgi:hypothetical protein
VILGLRGSRYFMAEEDKATKQTRKVIKTLEPKELRGIPNEAMCMSDFELGISDEHEGIILLEDEAPVGVPAADFMGDAVLAEGPNFLDQAVVELALPFARQERHDPFAALKELGAIAPAAVAGVGQRDAVGIARVPRILGHASLLGCCFEREGRKRRTAGGQSALLSMRGDLRQLRCR